MSHGITEASIVCVPVKILGMGMYKAMVITESGNVVFETTLWSEAGAKTAAYRWVQGQAFAARNKK